jgi:hypothetical protein
VTEEAAAAAVVAAAEIKSAQEAAAGAAAETQGRQSLLLQQLQQESTDIKEAQRAATVDLEKKVDSLQASLGSQAAQHQEQLAAMQVELKESLKQTTLLLGASSSGIGASSSAAAAGVGCNTFSDAHPNKQQRDGNGSVNGSSCSNRGRAKRAMVDFKLSASGLDNADGMFESHADPYLIVLCQEHDQQQQQQQPLTAASAAGTPSRGEWSEAFKSEVIKGSLSPSWAAFSLCEEQLCDCDRFRLLRLQVFDWNRRGKDTLIGEVQTSLDELLRIQGGGALSKGKQPSLATGPGTLELVNVANKGKSKEYHNSGLLTIEKVVERRAGGGDDGGGSGYVNGAAEPTHVYERRQDVAAPCALTVDHLRESQPEEGQRASEVEASLSRKLARARQRHSISQQDNSELQRRLNQAEQMMKKLEVALQRKHEVHRGDRLLVDTKPVTALRLEQEAAVLRERNRSLYFSIH